MGMGTYVENGPNSTAKIMSMRPTANRPDTKRKLERGKLGSADPNASDKAKRGSNVAIGQHRPQREPVSGVTHLPRRKTHLIQKQRRGATVHAGKSRRPRSQRETRRKSQAAPESQAKRKCQRRRHKGGGHTRYRTAPAPACASDNRHTPANASLKGGSARGTGRHRPRHAPQPCSTCAPRRASRLSAKH